MAVKHRRLPNGSYVPVDNVDANLEAAATPIAVEPTAGKAAPPPRDVRQRQIDRLVELGDDPETAAMVVDRLREIHGEEMSPELFDHYNTPKYNEPLRQRIAESKADNARMAAFETNYNAETGHPEYGYDEAGNAAKLGKVDIRNPSQGERHSSRSVYGSNAARRRSHARGGYTSEMDYANYPSDYDMPEETGRPFGGTEAVAPDFADYTAPGPRTLDGRPPAPARGLSAEEADAYNLRKPGQLSQRDRDMTARGYVPVVTPNGVVYKVSAATGGDGDGPLFPGGPGRAGDGRPDMVERGWVPVEMRSPDGQKVPVYTPGPEMKAKQAEDLKGRRAAYASKKARMDSEREAARQNWRATAMLAGGSHNLNSGNRWIANSLVGMNSEDRANAMKYMLPGGQLHAQVDAANAEAAASMAQRAMTAFLANNPGATPLQQAALEQQKAKDRQDMLTWAEGHIGDNYAYDSGWVSSAFGFDEFTPAEQEAAVNDIMQRYPGTTREQAREIVDSIAARKGGRQAAVPPAGATAPSAGGADGGFTG